MLLSFKWLNVLLYRTEVVTCKAKLVKKHIILILLFCDISFHCYFVDKLNKEYILQNDGIKLVTVCLSRQVLALFILFCNK